MRTDTHLPYTVLVQRWWRSTLGGRVAGGGHFQVTVGAAAPGVTFLGAPWHSVSGCLLLEATRSARVLFSRCKVDRCTGLRIQTARHGPVSWCGVRDSLLSNVTDSKNSDCDGRLSSQDERSLRSGMLPVCCCMPAWVHVCVWRCERASDALPRNSAGSMLPSLTVGNFANAAWLGRSMWKKNLALQLLKCDLQGARSNGQSDVDSVIIGWLSLE